MEIIEQLRRLTLSIKNLSVEMKRQNDLLKQLEEQTETMRNRIQRINSKFGEKIEERRMK